MTTKRKFTKTVGWGEAIQLEVHFRSPGLKPVVDAIHRAVGTSIGSRNTFAKLYECDDAPATDIERWRAWLLLTALGQDPVAWRIDDSVVPPAYDVERLRTLVLSQSRWITTGLPLDAIAA